MYGRVLGITSTVLVVVAAAAGWLYPLVTFAAAGYSLTGMHDEATGFLYFYSLRRLYGAGESPWLHSGQVPSLLHMALHLVLSAAGYPPTQIHPRLDIWSYIAPGTPLLVAALALGWAVQPIRSPLGRILVAVLFIAVTYETAIHLEYPLTTPGYHPWVYPVAVATLGWLLRVERTAHLPLPCWLALLGGFAGLCLSTNPTYAPYPATVGVALLLHQASVRRAAVMVGGSAIVAFVLLLATTWAMYVGDMAAVTFHFGRTATFVQQERSDRPPGQFLTATLTSIPARFPVSLTSIRIWVVTVPVLYALSLLLPATRRISFALLVGSALYLIPLDQRPSEATFTEVYAYFVVALAVWTARVLMPAVTCLAKRARATRVLAWASAALLLVVIAASGRWAYGGMARFDAVVRPAFAVATVGERQLQQYLDAHPGRTLFLLADYGHRPITVDAAIHRGGMSLAGSWNWASPLLTSMLPDRMYVLGSRGSREVVDLSPYQKVVYTYQPDVESEAAALQVLAERFEVRLDGWMCDFEYAFWDTYQPGQLTRVIVARACVRS